MSRSPITSHEEIDNRPVKCMVCGKEKTFAESMPAEMVRDSLRYRPIFCRDCA